MVLEVMREEGAPLAMRSMYGLTSSYSTTGTRDLNAAASSSAPRDAASAPRKRRT